MLLYKRAYDKKSLTPSNMKGFQWFALNKSSEDTYGPFEAVYHTSPKVQLFHLGLHRADAIQLVESAGLDPSPLDLNDQYSGGVENLRAHRLLRKVLEPLGFNGTFIDNSQLPDDDDEAGPVEVVLWSDRSMRGLVKRVTRAD